MNILATTSEQALLGLIWRLHGRHDLVPVDLLVSAYTAFQISTGSVVYGRADSTRDEIEADILCDLLDLEREGVIEFRRKPGVVQVTLLGTPAASGIIFPKELDRLATIAKTMSAVL